MAHPQVRHISTAHPEASPKLRSLSSINSVLTMSETNPERAGVSISLVSEGGGSDVSGGLSSPGVPATASAASVSSAAPSTLPAPDATPAATPVATSTAGAATTPAVALPSFGSLWNRVKSEANKQLEHIERASKELTKELTAPVADSASGEKEIIVLGPDGVPVVLQEDTKGKGPEPSLNLDETIKERSQQVDELFNRLVTDAKKSLSKENTQAYLTKGEAYFSKGESWLKSNLAVDLNAVKKELGGVFRVVPGETGGSETAAGVTAAVVTSGGAAASSSSTLTRTSPEPGPTLTRRQQRLRTLSADTAALSAVPDVAAVAAARAALGTVTPLEALERELSSNAPLAATLATLVPAKLSREAFADHYAVAVYTIDEEERKRQELLQRVSSSTSLARPTPASSEAEEPPAWSDDEAGDTSKSQGTSQGTETYDVVNAKSANPSETNSSEDSDWE